MTSFVFCTDRAVPCFSLSSLQSLVSSVCINFLKRKMELTDIWIRALLFSFLWAEALLFWEHNWPRERFVPVVRQQYLVVSCFLHNTFVHIQGRFSLYFSCTAIYWTGWRIVILECLDITENLFRKIFSLENIHCFDIVLKLSPQIHYNQTLAKDKLHSILQLTSCFFWI